MCSAYDSFWFTRSNCSQPTSAHCREVRAGAPDTLGVFGVLLGIRIRDQTLSNNIFSIGDVLQYTQWPLDD